MSTVDKPVKCSSGLGRLLLIPTLFVLLIILSKFGLAPLNSQWHTVIIVLVIYLIFVPFVFHNAFYITCKAKKSLKKLQEEIDTYLNSHQWKFEGTSKSIGSVEPLIENFEKHLRNDHFAGVAAGVFPTLGILGTFISIAISMPDFSVETSQALEEEISKLLGGVGTAFYASIFGIFLSLWWIFFEKSGLSHFDKILLKIQNEAQAKIWTHDELKLIELKQRQQIHLESKNLVDGLGLSRYNIQDELKGIYKSYAELHRDVNNLSQDIHIHVDNNIKQLTMSANNMHAQQILQKEMQSQIESLSLKLTRQSDEQAELHRRFENLIAIEEKITLSSQNIAEINASVLAKFENFNIDQTTQKLLDFTKALQDAQESQQDNYNLQMREGFELIDKEVSYVVKRLSEVAIEISKNGIHLSNVLKNKS
jgi:hypothetical protein